MQLGFFAISHDARSQAPFQVQLTFCLIGGLFRHPSNASCVWLVASTTIRAQGQLCPSNREPSSMVAHRNHLLYLVSHAG